MMLKEMTLESRDNSEVPFVGSYCEVFWSATNRLSKRQCEKCVYVVRGIVNDMICVELVYDAIDGAHRQDAVYWVPITSIQYLRVLTIKEAQRRVDVLEREAFEDMPRD